MTVDSGFIVQRIYWCTYSCYVLQKALDILVQFFLGPQFTESATEREVNAVDSENRNNYKVDSRRIYQLEKFVHVCAHF